MRAMVVSLLIAFALVACAPTTSPPSGSELSGGGTDRATCPMQEVAMEPEEAKAGDAIALTESIALEPRLFWSLIDSLPDSPVQADFDALAASLAECTAEQVLGFEARLTLALYALDGPDALTWYEENDPDGLGFVSEDTFLYARCATVLAGFEVWSTAVADRTVPSNTTTAKSLGEEELLLYVASTAADAQGEGQAFGDAVAERIRISYETGSNTQLWG